MIPEFRTLDDVVAGLSALEQRFRAAGDRRAIFATLYIVVSAQMKAQVAARAFADSEWVHRYAVAFANLYRQALGRYEDGLSTDVPKAWRLCFDAARGGATLVLQDMLLGINAHVNNDLPVALDTVSIAPDRELRYRDHAAVNAILGSVTERATERLAALYAPGFTSLDECAGQLDEIASAFSLEIARESAWEGAVALANARNPIERRLVTGMIGSRAAVLSRLLLAPSRNEPAIAACRQIEAGPHWLTVLASLHKAICDS
jgi:hypothetical protein